MNDQNDWFWSSKNPHIFQTSLHPQKINVWCAMKCKHAGLIFFFVFFEITVTGEVYHDIMQQFIALLHKDERDAVFHQNNACSHTSKNSISFLEECFGEQLCK